VLEAFASGVPVVATAADAVREVAGDAALLVPVAEVGELRAAVRRVLDEPSSPRHCGRAASRVRAVPLEPRRRRDDRGYEESRPAVASYLTAAGTRATDAVRRCAHRSECRSA